MSRKTQAALARFALEAADAARERVAFLHRGRRWGVRFIGVGVGEGGVGGVRVDRMQGIGGDVGGGGDGVFGGAVRSGL